ncbi:MAG: hypothetical protein ACI89D_002313, partial [Bermanella sp.]
FRVENMLFLKLVWIHWHGPLGPTKGAIL